MSDVRRSTFLWASAAIAFSPVLVEWGATLWEESTSRYVLCPLVMLIVLANRLGPGASPPATWPIALIAAGIGAELVAVVAETRLIGQLGLAIAAVGLALRMGRPAIGAMLLAFAAIPIPEFLKLATSPRLESLWAQVATAAYPWAAPTLAAGGPLILSGETRFELIPADGGIVTAHLFAAFGWYRACLHGRALPQAFRSAFFAGLAAIAVQPLIVIAAVGLVVLGAPELARLTLDHVVAILVLGVVGFVAYSAPRHVPTSTVTSRSREEV